ncbi:hypothetical protein [Nocardia gipuzkoensis]|uniref:hypothetical protein n=1 Tax=Nocardia gipuzkoensis TaxID=2749991 RepID=UPI00237E1E3D|nr:hypothetical protein [Nocardia gipuzkoensis]MDE1675130.1 hypothetical protein [Nocardia gipuzkoensis]
MSGTAEPVRDPKDDAEWARDTTRRLESLENPTSARVGPWVLSASDEGHLIASYVEGGSVVLARKPAAAENNPDDIDEAVNPSCSVTRTALYTIPANGGPVRFDGVEVNAGGDWTGGQSLFDAVIVPVSGAYRVTGTVQFSSHPSAVIRCAVRVDGAPRIAGGFEDHTSSASTNPWMTAMCTRVIQLNAGQSVDLFAYSNNSVQVGAATFWNPAVPTSLDLHLVTERE